jgi:hypothetical protein
MVSFSLVCNSHLLLVLTPLLNNSSKNSNPVNQLHEDVLLEHLKHHHFSQQEFHLKLHPSRKMEKCSLLCLKNEFALSNRVTILNCSQVTIFR